MSRVTLSSHVVVESETKCINSTTICGDKQACNITWQCLRALNNLSEWGHDKKGWGSTRSFQKVEGPGSDGDRRFSERKSSKWHDNYQRDLANTLPILAEKLFRGLGPPPP